MNSMKQLRMGVATQSRQLWRVLFFLYLPIVLFFLLVGLLSRISDDLTLALLMRDPITSGRLPVVAGLVSQVEAILWSASLTVCVFGWAMLQRRGNTFAQSRQFLLQFAIITAVLFLDDLFLFHGEIAPKVLHIPKVIIIAVYLVTIIAFLYSSWPEILSSEYLILMLALCMFGASIFLDTLPLRTFGVPQFGQQVRLFLEDGLKFAGVATWLTYFSRYTVRQIEAPSDT